VIAQHREVCRAEARAYEPARCRPQQARMLRGIDVGTVVERVWVKPGLHAEIAVRATPGADAAAS
jgi:hypothetical protein